MPLELDHFFICTERLAPAAAALLQFGLSEGASNRHPGQGTANRRFFFDSAFLELLWVDDAAETQSPAIAPTGLWQRWSLRDSGASPFGVCLRMDAAEELPFATWPYRPPYLPETLAIPMSTTSSDATAPLLFAITFGRRADSASPQHRQPLEHAAGVRVITRLRVTIPELDPAVAAEWSAVARHCPAIEYTAGDEPLLEIGFDDERQARTHDFRPRLPLRFHW